MDNYNKLRTKAYKVAWLRDERQNHRSQQMSKELASQDMPLCWVGKRCPLRLLAQASLFRGQLRQRGHLSRATGSEDKWPPAKSSVGQVGRSGNTHLRLCVCMSVCFSQTWISGKQPVAHLVFWEGLGWRGLIRQTDTKEGFSASKGSLLQPPGCKASVCLLESVSSS